MGSRVGLVHKSLAVFLVLQLVLSAAPANAFLGGSLASTAAKDRGTVPQSGVGGYGVNGSSGSVSQSIPIEVPPGTGGMAPQLGLSYNSSNRQGSWVGTGWSLGLSAISRSLKDGIPAYSKPGDDGTQAYDFSDGTGWYLRDAIHEDLGDSQKVSVEETIWDSLDSVADWQDSDDDAALYSNVDTEAVVISEGSGSMRHVAEDGSNTAETKKTLWEDWSDKVLAIDVYPVSGSSLNNNDGLRVKLTSWAHQWSLIYFGSNDLTPGQWNTIYIDPQFPSAGGQNTDVGSGGRARENNIRELAFQTNIRGKAAGQTFYFDNIRLASKYATIQRTDVPGANNFTSVDDLYQVQVRATNLDALDVGWLTLGDWCEPMYSPDPGRELRIDKASLVEGEWVTLDITGSDYGSSGPPELEDVNCIALTVIGNGRGAPSLEFGNLSRSPDPLVPQDQDVFALDGQELVQAVDESWHTKKESFRRIEYLDGSGWEVREKDGTVSRYGFYTGPPPVTSADPRFEDSTGDKVFSWLLTEREDLNGNAYRVFYHNPDGGTEFVYPKEIRYTLRSLVLGELGNGLQSLDGGIPASIDRIVRFALEVSPDETLSYITGLKQQRKRRLKNIDVMIGDVDVSGDLVRRYELEYSQSPDTGSSLLTKVLQYGSDADDPIGSTPPMETSFKYHSNVDAGTTGWTSQSWTWPTGLELVDDLKQDRGVRIADINGDGLPDLIRAFATLDDANSTSTPALNNGVYLNTGSGFETIESSVYEIPTFNSLGYGEIELAIAFDAVGQEGSFPWGLVVQDVTGDGRADILSRGWGLNQSGVRYPFTMGDFEGSASGFQVGPSEAVNAAFDMISIYETATQSFFQGAFGGPARLADLNGDGLPEFIMRANVFNTDGIAERHEVFSWVSENKGNLEFASPRWRQNGWPLGGIDDVYSSEEYQPCPQDSLEADCLQYFVQSATGYEGTFLTADWTWTKNLDNGVSSIDLNGDGLADLAVADVACLGDSDLCPSASYSGSTMLNNGQKGYTDGEYWSPPIAFREYDAESHSEVITKDLGARYADVNGDGRVDIIHAPPVSPGIEQSIWLNDGDAGPGDSPWVSTDDWDLPSGLTTIDDENRDAGLRFLDLDGDGMVDILRADESGAVVYLNNGQVPDLLRSVTTIQGGVIEYDYRPSTEYSHLGGDTEPDLPIVRQVVRDVRVYDGRGPVSLSRYIYKDGFYAADDREFRGFGQVVETKFGPDSERIRTFTTYHQDFAKSGLPIMRRVRDGSGQDWAVEEYEYVDDPVPPYVTLLKAKEVYEYDGTGNHLSETSTRIHRTEYVYDGPPGDDANALYGNLTKITVKGETTAADRVTDISYNVNDTLYLVDRVSSKVVSSASSLSPDNETHFYYDGETELPAESPTIGNLTQTNSDPTGEDIENRFEYDDYGNVTDVYDGLNSRTTTGFDPVFHTFPVSVDRPVLVPNSTVSYIAPLGICPDSAVIPPQGTGLPGLKTGVNGETTSFCYDAFGRTVKVASSSGAETETFYTDYDGSNPEVLVYPSVKAVSLLDPLTVRESESFLDGLGRTYQSRSSGPGAEDVFVDTVYDELGRVAESSAPYFEGDDPLVTSFVYDTLGRTIQTTRPGGRASRVYFNRGSVIATDANGYCGKTVSDIFGSVVESHEFKVQNESGTPDCTNTDDVVVTYYSYDHAGRLVKVIPPDSVGDELDTVIVFDGLGRKSSIDDPDQGKVLYTYDRNGNLLVQLQESGGAQITSRYDALNRLTEQTALSSPPADPANWEVRMSYDESEVANGLGRLTKVEDEVGTHLFKSYDANGKLTSEEHRLDGRQFSFSATYSFAGALKTRTLPQSKQVYSYDSSGYLLKLEETQSAGDPLQVMESVSLDAKGRVVSLDTADGVETDTMYDSGVDDQLEEIRIRRSAVDILQHYDYVMDPGGRVATMTDQLPDGPGSFSFAYDGLNRLDSATGPYGALDYDYDKYGNLTLKDGVSQAYGERGFGPHAVTTVGGVGGQLVNYDLAGNLREIGDRIYNWDARGRLASVVETETLATFGYDYSNRRVRSDQGGTVRYFVTSDFEWDGSTATVHYFAAGTRLASRSFAYSAPPVASLTTVDEEHWAELLVLGFIAVGPPLLLLFVFGLALQRGELEGFVLRRSIAAATLAFFWWSLTGPSVAYAFDVSVDADQDGVLNDYEDLMGSDPADASSTPGNRNGDLNYDGRLDAADGLLLRRQLLNELPDDLDAGDIAPMGFPLGDDEIAVNDLQLILRGVHQEDIDGDGIAENDELLIGTSPFLADTDGDGLTDFEETVVGSDGRITNPLSGDPDGDGISDLYDLHPFTPAPPSNWVFYHGDHLGSTTLLTNLAGVVLSQSVFKPFGEALQIIGATAEFGFTGQRYESALGIYDYNARWYDPVLGRFLSPDSWVESWTNPQTLNRYSYVRNNPVNRIDPGGNFSMSLGLGFGTFSYDSSVGWGGNNWDWGPSIGGSFSTGSYDNGYGFNSSWSYTGGRNRADFSVVMGGERFGFGYASGWAGGGGGFYSMFGNKAFGNVEATADRAVRGTHALALGGGNLSGDRVVSTVVDNDFVKSMADEDTVAIYSGMADLVALSSSAVDNYPRLRHALWHEYGHASFGDDFSDVVDALTTKYGEGPEGGDPWQASYEFLAYKGGLSRNWGRDPMLPAFKRGYDRYKGELDAISPAFAGDLSKAFPEFKGMPVPNGF